MRRLTGIKELIVVNLLLKCLQRIQVCFAQRLQLCCLVTYMDLNYLKCIASSHSSKVGGYLVKVSNWLFAGKSLQLWCF